MYDYCATHSQIKCIIKFMVEKLFYMYTKENIEIPIQFKCIVNFVKTVELIFLE